MTPSDIHILINAIHDTGKKLSPREQSIINNIVLRLQYRRPISEKQAWAIQAIYRKLSGGGQYIERQKV